REERDPVRARAPVVARAARRGFRGRDRSAVRRGPTTEGGRSEEEHAGHGGDENEQRSLVEAPDHARTYRHEWAKPLTQGADREQLLALGMLDLQRRVLDAEAIVELFLELTADGVAIVSGPYEHVCG